MPESRTKPDQSPTVNLSSRLLTPGRACQSAIGLLGGMLGLTLIKFGNPVILDPLIQDPGNGWELVFSTWPIRWAFDLFFGPLFFIGFLFLGCVVWFFRNTIPLQIKQVAGDRRARFSLSCLAGWYCWQWVASMDTVGPSLTRATLCQFTLCVLLFAVGLFCLSAVDRLNPLWWGLLAGFVVVLWSGMDQRFGGLDETRRMIYEQGMLDHYPAEFLRRISTGRVFGTLFYPNAFAGLILLFAPLMLTFVHHMTCRRGNIIRGLAVGLLGYLSVGGLYWSGSKSGWLIAVGMLLAIILRLPMPRRSRWLVIATVGVLALGVFGLRFAGYFQKGATSVSARFDYWRAAAQITIVNPLTGTGPGTFQVPYAALKKPESEMARLTHNDYLQQASDSGLPGFLLYGGLLLGSLGMLYRPSQGDPLRYSAWLGLAAWALQSIVEFGLYIPAIAWPAFTILGWLLGNGMDREDRSTYLHRYS